MNKFLLNFLRLLTLPNRTTKTADIQSGDFVTGHNEFFLNGKPFIIRAGELHYSRIPKKYWDQRIKTAKAMGLNTICINLLWNFHEQEQGIFDFTEKKEVAEFVYKIHTNGMYCILRPGPSVSAECDMGGLPWWLLRKDLKLQNHSDEFLRERMKIYLKEVGKQLAPYQIQNGGPIILVQVENEYGPGENDKTHMEIMCNNIRQVGFDKVQLLGSDKTSIFSINWKVVFEESDDSFKATNGTENAFRLPLI